ncbi:MAG: hypothetical protein R3F59_37425 [Myxococcota bacterium]
MSAHTQYVMRVPAPRGSKYQPPTLTSGSMAPGWASTWASQRSW